MISAIIPVYNVSKYLPRCLDSLIAQTCGDWEAVCVDDGSTDESSAILDEYALKDTRIRVFHTSNQGASGARNFALEKIQGELMMMIDSDDFIHPSTFEICASQFARSGADAVMFTYSRSYRTRTIVRHILHLPDSKPGYPAFDPKSIAALDSDDIFLWATEYSHPEGIDPKWAVKHCQPWRGIFRSSVAGNIKFIPGIIYEDFPWWSELMLKLRKVTIINLPLYYYYPNFNGYIISSSQNYRIESLRKAIEYTEKLYAESATEHQRALWERNFLTPFRKKLKDKKYEYKACDTVERSHTQSVMEIQGGEAPHQGRSCKQGSDGGA